MSLSIEGIQVSIKKLSLQDNDIILVTIDTSNQELYTDLQDKVQILLTKALKDAKIDNGCLILPSNIKVEQLTIEFLQEVLNSYQESENKTINEN